MCAVCHQRRTLRYAVAFLPENPAHLCPWCIADGAAAAAFDGEFTDYGAVEGIGFDPRVAPTVDLDDVAEVTQRTPAYPSWQEPRWLSHCNRLCAFIGTVAADDLPQYLDEPDFVADVDGGTGFPPDIVRSQLTTDGQLVGYLQCMTCQTHRLHVDAS